MFDAFQYSAIYHHLLMLAVLATALVYAQGADRIGQAISYNAGMIWAVSGFIILLLGTRPVSGAFIDMPAYASTFNRAEMGADPSYNDWGFNVFVKFCAMTMSMDAFFLLCVVIYVSPLVWGLRYAHGNWAFAVFLALAGSTSFFAYGVNGIRNGLSTSLLIAAFACRDRKLVGIVLMAAAFGMHKSALLPIAAFLVTGLYSPVWLCAAIWVGAFIVSSTIGEAVSSYVSNLPLFSIDERLASYADAMIGMGQDKGGFRWDFVLYSIVPIAISYALASSQTRKGRFYRRLVCTYLLSNAFWLLVIYASQSNRFAYLSWFLLPWVIIYPFVPRTYTAPDEKGEPIESPRVAMLGAAIFAHYLFTYVMMIFIYPNRK